MGSLGPGTPATAIVQSGSISMSSGSAAIERPIAARVVCSTLAQSVRSSPRLRLLAICLAEYLTVSFFFAIPCSPCGNEPYSPVAPHPDHREKFALAAQATDTPLLACPDRE